MIGSRSQTISAVLAAASLLGFGLGRASAQETIPTAADAPLGGAPTPPPMAPQGLERPWLAGGPDIVRNVNACGVPPKEDGSPDKSVHGEVYAGIGNHGYREAGGAACIPIGDHAAATIAVDVGQYPGAGWRGRP
jgi:hypothetical protein